MHVEAVDAVVESQVVRSLLVQSAGVRTISGEYPWDLMSEGSSINDEKGSAQPGYDKQPKGKYLEDDKWKDRLLLLR